MTCAASEFHGIARDDGLYKEEGPVVPKDDRTRWKGFRGRISQSDNIRLRYRRCLHH